MAKKTKSEIFDDLFDDHPEQKSESEFDALLNSTKTTVREGGLLPGDRFKGEVLAITGGEAFLSTGTPVDAVMPFALGREEDRPQLGDMIDVVVLRSRDGEVLVKPINSRGGDIEADSLEQAFEMEMPVEGLVLEEVKGGFRVKVKEMKAFCPLSQMDSRVVNASDYVGRKFHFLITKLERGRDLVVSRRRLLDQEKALTAKEFLSTAEVGEIYSGKIFRLEKYGAFVRLDNGLEGLIPISELSYGRIGHPQEVVNLDQPVQVKLIRMLDEKPSIKLTFSVKQGGGVSDPWTTIESDFPQGRTFEGIVENKESYGLFVRLGHGVTGLLPRSAWRDSDEASVYESKRKGDTVTVRVDRVDLDSRKLSLGVPGEEEDHTWKDHSSVKKSGFGSMADLFKGVKGSES